MFKCQIYAQGGLKIMKLAQTIKQEKMSASAFHDYFIEL